ncbi:hypothetical protein B0H13DRAFT_1888776 [Mycena leptocephala]|nr:hypothetical protein B0H13DRAFT_1888776 [Mycena leptocephala]
MFLTPSLPSPMCATPLCTSRSSSAHRSARAPFWSIWSRRRRCGRGGVGVEGEGKGKKEKKAGRGSKTKRSTHTNPTQPPFTLRLHTLHPAAHARRCRRHVGSGKTSLLQGLVGRCPPPTLGEVAFGSVVYCPQSAWIQNATLRDNCSSGSVRGQVLAHHRRFVFAPDLQLLADGDLTEMCVWIVHDKFDANVGKALFRSAIQGLVAGQDCSSRYARFTSSRSATIYTRSMAGIAEAGTYPELIAHGGEFAGSIASLGGEAEDAGREAARGEWDEDEAQFGKEIDNMDVFRIAIDNALLCPDLTEDPAIVAKRTQLAQRVKMLEGIRKDLMAFENRRGQCGIPLGLF